jgi:hypothetical protein
MSLVFWQSLLGQLEIIESSAEEYGISQADFQYDVMSIEECNFIERMIDVAFPESYKEFCQVFGSGCFGNDFMAIQCPNNFYLNSLNPSKLNCIRHSGGSSSHTIFGHQELMNLIDSAFVFGGYDYFTVFWDIRTYKHEDDSYDIYWALDECFQGEIFKVGRDFSEFIREFCLGNGLLEFLPPDLHELSKGIAPIFKRYPRISIEDN